LYFSFLGREQKVRRLGFGHVDLFISTVRFGVGLFLMLGDFEIPLIPISSPSSRLSCTSLQRLGSEFWGCILLVDWVGHHSHIRLLIGDDMDIGILDTGIIAQWEF
jgi:hypothetical protein